MSCQALPKEQTINKLRKELQTYLNVVKDNPMMFFHLTSFGAIDGHTLDPECCKPIDNSVLQKVCKDALQQILQGMKVDGTPNNWSCGFLGSRWFDIDTDKYNLAHIRVAFYSKTSSPKLIEKYGKPFVIQITCEKN